MNLKIISSNDTNITSPSSVVHNYSWSKVYFSSIIKSSLSTIDSLTNNLFMIHP